MKKLIGLTAVLWILSGLLVISVAITILSQEVKIAQLERQLKACQTPPLAPTSSITATSTVSQAKGFTETKTECLPSDFTTAFLEGCVELNKWTEAPSLFRIGDTFFETTTKDQVYDYWPIKVSIMDPVTQQASGHYYTISNKGEDGEKIQIVRFYETGVATTTKYKIQFMHETKRWGRLFFKITNEE